jgi:phosphate-selective porin OprO/OprP
VIRGLSPASFRPFAILALVALAWLASPRVAPAQAVESTIDTTVGAGDADAEEPKRKFVKWNEYDGPISTLRFGYGFLVDFAAYSQDDASQQQVSPRDDIGLRDLRLLFKGRFKTQRQITWTIGYMYDGSDDSWHFRQTGVEFALPELSGRVFVGRTKEGYSFSKVMVGYYIWEMERSQSLDAFIPILGDGVKYMMYSPRRRFFGSLGYFWDWASETEKFAIYDNQWVARAGMQPVLSDERAEVLHVAVMGRLTTPDEGKIRFKSKPGSYLAPVFLDTGTLTSDDARTFGFEAAYRRGPWMYYGEYDWQNAKVDGLGTPMFHGGEVSVSWIVSGETRPYNVVGAFFNQVTPRKSVFEGGRGALEASLILTVNDFDDGSILGGKFWRITPMAKWYLSEQLRVELGYGYGELERFGLTGKTHFYQARLVSIL